MNSEPTTSPTYKPYTPAPIASTRQGAMDAFQIGSLQPNGKVTERVRPAIITSKPHQFAYKTL
ncbi:MAG: hypothetical protein H7255_09035 [Ramlibacter sp.]|nr:hypothetical protein [Ramlibacter sp.]